LGEELFLVHLRRESAASEAEIYKHQALVGQELWKVHCQRSRGYSLEQEQEDAQEDAAQQQQQQHVKPKANYNNNNNNNNKSNKKKALTVKAKKPIVKPAVVAAAAVQTRYNLRSKDGVVVTQKKE
jgi:hypothetical protein